MSPRTRHRLVGAVATVVTTLTLLPSAARADPSQATIAAKRQLEKIQTEVEIAAEHYDGARIALGAAQRDVAAAQGRIAAKEAALRTAQRGMGRLASYAYMNGGGDELVRLMTDARPDDFLDRATTVDAVARSRSSQLRTIRAARRELRAAQDLAKEKLARAATINADMARTKARIEKALATQRVLVARLESADARRERLAREAAARRAAALAAARAKARLLEALRASRSRTFSYTGSASGRATAAVAEAYRQLGKPYEWGAAGPDTFDCSGLTMWAWARAGVSLPHSSQAQFGEGHHVSTLQPGDLVFFGHPIHHVGIFVGNGQMIDAPHTGAVVQVDSAFRSDYAGAVRL